MKLKIIIAAFGLFALEATNIHSLGFGAQFNIGAGDVFAPGAALVLSPSTNMHLAGNWFVDPINGSTVALTVDRTVFTFPLHTFDIEMIETFNLTVGGGIFAKVTFGDDAAFNGGFRLPVGLNIFLLRNVLELYTHLAPSLGLRFIPNFGLSNPFFPIAIGARVWLFR